MKAFIRMEYLNYIKEISKFKNEIITENNFVFSMVTFFISLMYLVNGNSIWSSAV